MVSVMLYPCMFCVSLSIDRFVMCVACMSYSVCELLLSISMMLTVYRKIVMFVHLYKY